jgi:hypothetical protein
VASFEKQDESTSQVDAEQDRITRLELMQADTDARNAMGEQGIVIQRAVGGIFVQHPASNVEPRRSIHSGPWYDLKVEEWYSSGVTLQVKAHGSNDPIDVQEEDVDEDHWETRFHGTVFKAFLSVISDGGLVAGPNGHYYKGKTLLGMFCCKSLSEAFLRVAPERGIAHSKPGAGLDLGCMPVVLELKAVGLRRFHMHRKDVQVVPGTLGCFVTGVRVTKVHLNKRFFTNFWRLAQMPSPVALSGVCGSGSESFTTCGCPLTPDWISKPASYVPGEWYKSKSRGHLYCPNCAGYIVMSHTHRWLGTEP